MLKLANLKTRLEQQIWHSHHDDRASARLDVIGIARWLYVLVREVTMDDLNYRAMGLVYTTLLSLAPLLAVSFSVLKAFGVHNQLEPFLLELMTPLGSKAPELVHNIIGFVENIQVGVLGSLGLVILLYSVVALLIKIEDSFNQIWRTDVARGWIRRFSDYLSILLIGPVLIFAALGMTASMANTGIVLKITALEPFGTVYYLLGLILPYLLIIAAFTFVYSFIPNTRVEFRAAVIGGTFACLAWKLLGWLFGLFVAESASYNAIYSGFAIVILFMIWLYVTWLILLLGGVISFYCQHPRYLDYKSRSPELSHRELESLGLLLMYLIGKAYYYGDKHWTLSALADEVHMPWEPVFKTLKTLQQAHLIVTLHEEPESYLPARDLETIRLQELYQALRCAGESENDFKQSSTNVPPNLADLTLNIQASADAVLQNLSLRDLICDR